VLPHHRDGSSIPFCSACSMNCSTRVDPGNPAEDVHPQQRDHGGPKALLEREIDAMNLELPPLRSLYCRAVQLNAEMHLSGRSAAAPSGFVLRSPAKSRSIRNHPVSKRLSDAFFVWTRWPQTGNARSLWDPT